MLNTSIAPWPHFDQDEINAVTEVLKSGKVNQWTGSEVVNFEKEFADYIGTRYAVAVSNGTVALDLILDAYKSIIGDGEIIVTSRTFIASVSSIVMAGAKPVFADVDLNSGNITRETIEKVLTPNTKAIICVHLAGWPCDMYPIMDLAEERDLVVIEDCAQAHGAIYEGIKVGNLGHAACWSFCQDKIMTTGGEGGMITTSSRSVRDHIWSQKDHGKNPSKMQSKPITKGFRWVHDNFGSNYRMTEMQAAIGRIQLKKLDYWVNKRNYIASLIDSFTLEFSAIRHAIYDYDKSRHAKYKHYLYVNPEGLNEGWSRDRIIKELDERGVPCYVGSCSEVYLESAFLNTTRLYKLIPHKRLPNAKFLGETSLMFLVHPNITKEQIFNMLANIMDVLKRASKEILNDRFKN